MPSAWLTIFVGAVIIIALSLTYAVPYVPEVKTPWLTALAEISRYESEDEIAAASTPAQAKPARIGGR